MKQNPLFADLQHILDHTRDLWEELRGERIFITGGTGFFGCWLLESFLFANHHLRLKAKATVLTRRPEAIRQLLPHLMQNSAITLHEGDVRSFKFPAGEYSHIIHAATDASAKLNRENPLLMLDTIVDGTRHTLDFACHCRAKRFLLTSSGAVYGKQPVALTHIPEDYAGAPDPLDPQNAYGQGKRQAEHLCALYASSSALEPKIARCFAFVGPYLPLNTHYAVGNFIHDSLRGGPIIITGDGTPHRSYLYAADLAIWLWTILLKGKSLEAYNVGSDESFTIENIAKCIAEQFRQSIAIELRGISFSGTFVERYVPSIQRAKCVLGLQQFFSFEDAVKQTIAYLDNRLNQT